MLNFFSPSIDDSVYIRGRYFLDSASKGRTSVLPIVYTLSKISTCSKCGAGIPHMNESPNIFQINM